MFLLWLALSVAVTFYPCKPPLIIGKLLLSQESCSSSLDFATFFARLPVVVIEMLLYFDMFTAAYVYVVCVVFIHFTTFFVKTRAECNACVKSPNLLKRIVSYKTLQVWDKARDSFMRGRLMSMVMAFGPMIQVNCISALILFGSGMSLLDSTFLHTIALEAIVFVFFTQAVAAHVYGKSKRFLGNLACSNATTKLWKKIICSMQPIKVHFGANFIDELTSLVVQDCCWRQTASFVLLYRKNV